MTRQKFFALDELAREIARLKDRGKKIVLANGCFDLIHVGHIRYLREAKTRGDILVVALNSDHSIRQLKGPGRPLLEERERVEIMAGLEFVDFVTIFDDLTVEKVLRLLQPHVHAKGSDYTQETVPERETAKAIKAEIAITGGPKVRSTSEIIKEIKRKFSPNREKNSADN